MFSFLNKLTVNQGVKARLDSCIGGRIAEEVIYGLDNVETGAESDFQQMMHLARNYVMRWGFSDKVVIF